MVNFDIESLFIKIPLQEAIDLCVENLFQDRTHVDKLLKEYVWEYVWIIDLIWSELL